MSIEQFSGWIHRTANEVLKGRSNHDRARFYEDLVQEGWVSAYSALRSHTADAGSSLQSWIITSVKRDMVRYLEKEDCGGAQHDDIDELVDVDDVDELIDYEVTERVQARADLSKLVDKLPERDANVVKMYYFQNYSEQDIARRLGVSRSMVSKIRNRAVAKIQQLVG